MYAYINAVNAKKSPDGTASNGRGPFVSNTPEIRSSRHLYFGDNRHGDGIEVCAKYVEGVRRPRIVREAHIHFEKADLQRILEEAVKSELVSLPGLTSLQESLESLRKAQRKLKRGLIELNGDTKRQASTVSRSVESLRSNVNSSSR